MNAIVIKYFIKCFVVIITAGCLFSCKKFTDVPAPNNQLSSGVVYTNNATLKSAVAGMYATLAVSNSFDLQTGLTACAAMSADEMVYPTGTDYDGFVYNTLSVNDFNVLNQWAGFYETIYQANSIIEGVQNSAKGVLTDSLKNNVIGECKFLRAFCHFYLTNLWGKVPLITSTDAMKNNTVSRSEVATVYNQIILDLLEAKNLLRKDYVYAGGERTRVNAYGAMALLARVYLYNGNTVAAEAYADSVLSATSLYGLLPAASLGGLFVKNNTEAIFQLVPSSTPGYTSEGNYFQLLNNSIPYYAIPASFVNAFETGDKRLANWVGVQKVGANTYYYPYKYKQRGSATITAAEYVTFLRLGEQYLVRAEARNGNNNISGALDDINVIRARAGLGNVSASTTEEVKLLIEKERRLELMNEYGHRWLDLKRTKRADAVLGAVKTSWTSNAALYPIPLTEINNNHNLTQNDGYK
ncbi:SusD family protein [Filimonas lacunae]|uniref:SusD family protein n=1 Tax=Filimonas lacunae TaxID=477680 RepID=A0A173MBN2_9BACT|nr:RagB/SusD family nutrient uptake outer membrane protein [Filimonas lacunae]BAV04955.1 RagB/SusD domain protein [Filimonas lacunae]SIT33729.1 SusD family protein [Filimonas lacunae]